MERTRAIIGSVLFFFLAPGVVAGLAPWWITGWDVSFSGPARIAIGGLMTLLGAAIVAACFARFAIEGRGTPAPVAPPGTLVLGGLYRFVRNPMYLGVILAVFGQALAFYSPGLIAYGVTLWLAFHAFVMLYEEPTLKAAFPERYEAYFAAVPRWIPRLTPWTP
ncbi:MAG: methyltransferase family protein [Pseudomonadota bacterium]